jgi:hypothetical protein
MTKIYCKLTDQNMRTHNGFQWKLGKKEIIKKKGGKLCSDSYFHCYEHPLLAVLLNPIHANIKRPRLFLIEVGGECKDDNGLKCGFKEMTMIEEIELPDISLNQKIAFGILCALEVYKEDSFVKWANNWLSNIDRSKTYDDVGIVVCAAAYAAADAAAYAANVAAYAASNKKCSDLISLAKKTLTYN